MHAAALGSPAPALAMSGTAHEAPRISTREPRPATRVTRPGPRTNGGAMETGRKRVQQPGLGVVGRRARVFRLPSLHLRRCRHQRRVLPGRRVCLAEAAPSLRHLRHRLPGPPRRRHHHRPISPTGSAAKKLFVLTVLLMSVPTFLMGLLPTYAMVGWLAPATLLLLRILQGCAVGGELPRRVGVRQRTRCERSGLGFRAAPFRASSTAGY